MRRAPLYWLVVMAVVVVYALLAAAALPHGGLGGRLILAVPGSVITNAAVYMGWPKRTIRRLPAAEPLWSPARFREVEAEVLDTPVSEWATEALKAAEPKPVPFASVPTDSVHNAYWTADRILTHCTYCPPGQCPMESKVRASVKTRLPTPKATPCRHPYFSWMGDCLKCGDPVPPSWYL